MGKFRQIYCDFWQNSYIQEELTPEDKLFYLYLMTNPKTTQLGVYSISQKQMSFDLGYSMETIKSLMLRFEQHHKLIKYDTETKEIVLVRWAHRNLVRGGKPVEDLLKKELLAVKNKDYLKIILEDCPENKLKIIIEDFYTTNKIKFLPSKDAKRRYIRLREGNKCFYTGVELDENFEIDHIVEKSMGGNNSTTNLVACDPKFNNDKSMSSLWEICEKYNLNYEKLENKIKIIKEFEAEREKNRISYRESIENNIYDLDTLRNYINTYRKNEDENISENDEANKINDFYDTSAIKNKEEEINNNNNNNKEEVQKNLYRLNENQMEQDLIYKELVEQEISEEVGMLLIDFLEGRASGEKIRKSEVRYLLAELKTKYSDDETKIKALQYAIASRHKSLVYISDNKNNSKDSVLSGYSEEDLNYAVT